MGEAEYCPLCGAHEMEWHEGESTDKTILYYFVEEIEKLYKKLQELKKRGEKI